MSHGPLIWIAFVAGVVALIALDLGITGQRHRAPSFREAVVASLLYIGVALAFGAGVWSVLGGEAAAQFYTAWLVEKSLSVDNLFVFLMVFDELRVPAGEQHRVLTWGILGALVLRGVMIFGGLQLIRRFEILTFALGALLIVSAVRAVRAPQRPDGDVRRKRWVRRLERWLPLASHAHGGRFFAVENGRRVGTLLLLRALFFVLARAMSRLRYLHYGLAAVLALIGVKMCVGQWVRVPTAISLAVTLAILVATSIASLVRDGRLGHSV